MARIIPFKLNRRGHHRRELFDAGSHAASREATRDRGGAARWTRRRPMSSHAPGAPGRAGRVSAPLIRPSAMAPALDEIVAKKSWARCRSRLTRSWRTRALIT